MAQLTDPEFLAMRRVAKILEPLTVGQRRRVLAYATDRFGPAEPPVQTPAWVLSNSAEAS